MNGSAGSTGFAEGSLGAGALAVGIIGLAGLAPYALASIGVIIVGLLFLMSGAQSSRRARQALAEAGASAGASGLSSHTVAGGAGLILGILGLLNVVPSVLTGVAVIAFGAAFILAANAQARNAQSAIEQGTASAESREAAKQALANVTTGQVLIGAADLVLGIIAVASTRAEPMTGATLVLVAILTTGSGSFLSGAGGERLLGMIGL